MICRCILVHFLVFAMVDCITFQEDVGTNQDDLQFDDSLQGKSEGIKTYLKQQQEKNEQEVPSFLDAISYVNTSNVNSPPPYESLQKIQNLLESHGLLGSSRFSSRPGSKVGPENIRGSAYNNKPPVGSYNANQVQQSSRPIHHATTGNRPYSGNPQSASQYAGNYKNKMIKNQYKHTWIEMLKETYKILQDKSILNQDATTSKMNRFLFDFLNDIEHLQYYQPEIECPSIYSKVGDLCLSLDFIETFLDFQEARLYCQVVKGGDLAMFRDPNEFADIQRYIRTLDPERFYSYWIGLTDEETENEWKFIDGRTARFSAPFWGISFNKVDFAYSDSERDYITCANWNTTCRKFNATCANWTASCSNWSASCAVINQSCIGWQNKSLCDYNDLACLNWQYNCSRWDHICDHYNATCRKWNYTCVESTKTCAAWNASCASSSVTQFTYNANCVYWNATCTASNVTCANWTTTCNTWNTSFCASFYPTCTGWNDGYACGIYNSTCLIWRANCSIWDNICDKYRAICTEWTYTCSYFAIECAQWNSTCNGSSVIGPTYNATCADWDESCTTLDRRQQPEFNNIHENHALLLNRDWNYIHDASPEEAEKWNTIPLCQFIPERDRTNFQYGVGIWDEWNGNNELQGWHDDKTENYIEYIGPTHQYGHQNHHYHRPHYHYGNENYNYHHPHNHYGYQNYHYHRPHNQYGPRSPPANESLIK